MREVHVDLKRQRLRLHGCARLLLDAAVSTAVNGPGERRGSECTPRGWHVVRAKIGANAPPGAVFVARRPTGEVCGDALISQYPNRDWVLTRILWLSGLEVGRNRLGNVDSMQRYIYIHGCPDSVPMGMPGSHGCIRMRNRDVVTLFDLAPLGTRVHIE